MVPKSQTGGISTELAFCKPTAEQKEARDDLDETTLIQLILLFTTAIELETEKSNRNAIVHSDTKWGLS
jgi:hypothetical protein